MTTHSKQPASIDSVIYQAISFNSIKLYSYDIFIDIIVLDVDIIFMFSVSQLHESD